MQRAYNSDKFINLKAPLLEFLLKRDDLDMDDIEIWENLLKWCFSQQNVKDDPANWNIDDILILLILRDHYIDLFL